MNAIVKWRPMVDSVYQMDALQLMHSCAPGSVDAIITDLPYGTTACSWDTIIPFDALWAAVRHCLKPRGVFVTTASQPFTSALVMSNPAWFRYEWVWAKSNGGGFLNANRMPLKRHENVLVFSEVLSWYYPQMTVGKPYRATSGAAGETTFDQSVAGWLTENNGARYPTSVIYLVNETGLHPTQKPVSLMDYLIRTYTQAGQLVIDPFCGSGTTAVAARRLGRRFICGDTNPEYAAIARNRLALPFAQDMFASIEGAAS